MGIALDGGVVDPAMAHKGPELPFVNCMHVCGALFNLGACMSEALSLITMLLQSCLSILIVDWMLT